MKTRQPMPSVTFFVSAYNEENNIEKFLRSILSQKESNFSLKKIVVVSDGSKDNTAGIVRNIKSKKIQLIEDKKRIGKSSRLNAVYKNLKTDILVQSDADVVFADRFVISNLIKPLIRSSKVGLVGGNPIAAKERTFTERAINITHGIYRNFRDTVRGGDNIFSADGRLLGLSKKFANQLEIPKTMIANDMFAYFACISKGFEYKYVKNAIVLYRSPQTLRDHIKQNTRFEAGPIRMKYYFESKVVDDETFIPKKIFIKGLIFACLKFPAHSFYIFLVNTYCRFLAKKNERLLNAKWDMAYTTKQNI